VGEPLGRRHADDLRGEAEQRLLRVLAREVGSGEYVARDHALGEVVEPGEVLASGDGDAPASPQVLERGLAVAPAPPLPTRGSGVRQLGHGDRASGRDLVVHGVHEPRVEPGAVRSDGARGVVGVHLVAEQRVGLDRQEVGRAGRAFEQLVPLVGEPVERTRRVGAQPGERHQVVRSGEHVDRVDVDGLQAPGHGPHVGDRRLRRASPAEPLRAQHEPPGLAPGQLHRPNGTGLSRRHLSERGREAPPQRQRARR
jgi:hypothetical protein